MKDVYLLTGSNLGDRNAFLRFARNRIQSRMKIDSTSSVYESIPWGYQSESSFLNQCLRVETELGPQELLSFLKEIEKQSGRKKKSPEYEDRSLDIDILFYGKEIIYEKDLVIPHPRLHLRAFTLVPLIEIASGFIHPVLGKTPGELLDECPDKNLPGKYDAFS